MANPLDHPLIWQGLVKGLTSALGVGGDFQAVHDTLVLERFCDAFCVSIDDVSARLEAYVHVGPEAIN
jgi:hypothetical protein